MSRITLFLALIIFVQFSALCGASCAQNTLSPDERTAGWRLLFDGETLDGWLSTGNLEGWAVDGGSILNLAQGGSYLATEEQFANFALSFEFKIEPGANSGLFFRWANLRDPVQTGIELQIFDSYGVEPPGKHDCGAIYDCLAPRKNVCKPAGEWNHIVLTCRRNRIWVDMNGSRIIFMNLDKWTTPHLNPDGTNNKFDTAYRDMPRKGHIGIQDHGARVWFRNVKIREFQLSP